MAPLDIIFDLDWTLISPTTEETRKQSQKGLIEVNGQIYRLNSHALPVLEYLFRTPDYRVSLFSGGEKDRNNSIAELLLSEIRKHNPKANFHKVLHKEDLAVHSTDKSLPFSERNKKDLVKAGFSLTSSLLIDDIKDFTPKSQEKNILWLGSTFNDQPSFNPTNAGKAYFPQSEMEWQKEQLKLVIALDRIRSGDLEHQRDLITQEYPLEHLNKTLEVLKDPEHFRLPPLCRIVFQ